MPESHLSPPPQESSHLLTLCPNPWISFLFESEKSKNPKKENTNLGETDQTVPGRKSLGVVWSSQGRPCRLGRETTGEHGTDRLRGLKFPSRHFPPQEVPEALSLLGQRQEGAAGERGGCAGLGVGVRAAPSR